MVIEIVSHSSWEGVVMHYMEESAIAMFLHTIMPLRFVFNLSHVKSILLK